MALAVEERERAERVLRQRLVGSTYTAVSLGDVWALCFDGAWIVAQDIRSPDEKSISVALSTTRMLNADSVDAEQVPVAVAVLANRRQVISELLIGNDAALKIVFANGQELYFPTATDVVDWQWALTRHGNDPHAGFLVACFWPGKIEFSDDTVAQL